jgi:autophagy-related protein 16
MVDEGGNTCVSGHLDNNLRVWDLHSGKAIKEMTGIHSGQVTGICISRDRNQLLTTSRDNTLKLIDARMWDVVKTLSAETFRVGLNHSKSTLSPDGHYALSGSQNGDVFGWNTVTGQVESILKVHSLPICGVVWGSGSKVISADAKNVTIWGSAQDQLLHV